MERETDMSQGPVIIELDEEAISPADAPPVPEIGSAAMPALATALGAPQGRVSRIGKWLVAMTGALITGWIGIALWSFVQGLLASSPILGMIYASVVAVAVGLLLIVAARELLAYRRLGRLDELQTRASSAISDGSRDAGMNVASAILGLYRNRRDLSWKIQRTEEMLPDQMDAHSVLNVVEVELLDPLDKAALLEIEAASRRVATLTALIPLALADVAIALAVNLRMVRSVAQIYGGRSGTFGSWRLVRAVITHLVATGAVSIGDDLIGSVAGGTIASKISRRFGEGIINGALTARVGIAAMTLCRPMPFVARDKPKTAAVLKRALTGVFSKT